MKIPNAITTRAARAILVTQKNSPTLLFVGGVVGVVATTVLAARATLKLDKVLEESQEKAIKAEALAESGHPDYSDTDFKKDLVFIKVQTVVEICKLYGPTVIVGSAAIAALAGSHNILTRRNAALTAAYTALDTAFKQYRGRVVEELGTDKDKEFRYSSKEVTLVEDTAKGPKKVRIKRFDDGGSEYSRLFSENNQNWSPAREVNLMFLRAKQNYANDRLKAKGFLLLNDVYDDLGFDRTTPGAVVGWVWDPNGNSEGDNYVDFNIWTDKSMERLHEFMVGHENSILLDFNVDGVVYDKISGV